MDATKILEQSIASTLRSEECPTLKMEAEGSSRAVEPSYKTTHHIREDCNLNINQRQVSPSIVNFL
jgi:hypothetical protein